MLIVAYFISLIIVCVYSGDVTRDLFDIEVSTKAVFFDYDKTLTAEGFGGTVLDYCTQIVNISDDCTGEGELTQAFNELPDPLEDITEALGGAERVDRLKAFLDRLLNEDRSTVTDNNIYIVSTSWEPVPAVEWAKMIFASLEEVGLDVYFPYDHVLTLDDPGLNIQADKGGKAEEALAGQGITMAECVFSDDKQGNLNWVNCDGTDPDIDCDEWGGIRQICDTVFLPHREGFTDTDFNYLEARAMFVPGGDCDSVGHIAVNQMVFVAILFMICAYLL